jgi:5-(carboxyamino)imidazole ribonucleotide synthase
MTEGKRIGIVGGGQLGAMMVPPALDMGYGVTVVDPTPDAPAVLVGAKQIIAPLTDEAATRQLAMQSDFLGIEIEHVNAGILWQLKQEGHEINPDPTTLMTIKDKLVQKQFLQHHNIPVAPFSAVGSLAELHEVAKKYGYSCVVKSRFGAYDGRGNRRVHRVEDLDGAFNELGGKNLYVEQVVPFEKELSIMVARSKSGDITTYPVVQTIHKDNICHTVLAPAPIDEKIYAQVEELARETMSHMQGASVFGIEFFMGSDGIMINEIAPRVHNSGHLTIEACKTSQFEQHIRAITGQPLGESDMKFPAAVMINILGDRQGPAEPTGVGRALELPGVGVHIYGKQETKLQRKMGHITVVADSLARAQEIAQVARGYISI